jgi:hypothetical protein
LLLLNPYLGARTEPVFGAAVTPGQTGYLPVSRGGVHTGFLITGVGHCAGDEMISILQE